MENQKYAKIFKYLQWALMIVSVGVLVYGWIKGYPAEHDPDNGTVAPLMYWTYIVIGLALASIICIGIYTRATTDPKSLVKLGIVVAGALVLIGLVYVISPGNPAIGLDPTKHPTPFELKLTDIILNLAYIVGSCSILSIIAGEVVMSLRKK